VSERGLERIVWSRGGVVTTVCPKSIITAQSEALVHMFSSYKALNSRPQLDNLDGRVADALVVLENEWRKELRNASRER
jgi:hypothetical protein